MRKIFSGSCPVCALQVAAALICLLARTSLSQTALSDVQGQWRGGTVLGSQTVSPGCVAIEWIEQTAGWTPVPATPLELRGLWVRTARWVWAEPDQAKQAGCRWDGDEDPKPSAFATTRQAITSRYDPVTKYLLVHLRWLDCTGAMCSVLTKQNGVPPTGRASVDRPQNFTLRYGLAQLLTGPSDGARPVELHRTADVAADIEQLSGYTDTMRATIAAGHLEDVKSRFARANRMTLDGLQQLQHQMNRELTAFNDSRVMTFELGTASGGRRVIAVFDSVVAREDNTTFQEYVFWEWEDGAWKLLLWLHA